MNDIGGGLDGRLAEGTQMKGTLKFERALQIDGRFEGNIKSPGKLILGASAQVEADIAVGELEVQGTLRGKVQAKNRLVIREGGVVDASIVTGRLAIESGAVFRGNCEMPDGGGGAAAAGGAKTDTKPAPESSSSTSKDAAEAPKPGAPK